MSTQNEKTEAPTETDEVDQSALIEALEAERINFEAWITAPPFEQDVSRNPLDPTIVAWPGMYKVYAVELAWEAWVAAKGF